ncbi:MAG: O-antigen ligase family protein [Lachnospiraceae bacterium]|nr:O-antigen ligase family protein [Lachnospiraceae bacterium]
MKYTGRQMRALFEKQVLGRNFLYGIFLLAVMIVALEAQVVGLFVFAAILIAILVFCDDLMPTLLPFLLTCVFLSTMYDSYHIFIKLWWLAIPFAAAVVFHFVYYRKKITVGKLFPSLLLVSAALLLGGVGMIPAKQYFSPISLYYTLGLGLGMVLIYLLVRSQYAVPRNYDVLEYFAYVMYLMGLFAAFVVLFKYAEKMEIFLETFEALELPSRNNYATFLMFAMPFPFYQAIRRKHHVFIGLFLYGCIVLTGSRGGLLCGAVELVLCFVYLAYVETDKEERAFNIGMLCGLLVLAIMAYPMVIEFYNSRCDDGDFFNDLGGRIPMAKRAFLYLRENFLFGSGVGYQGNVDIYNPKTGALCWYHSLPFQIIGSMGLFGVFAYAYHYYNRLKIMLVSRQPLPLAISLSCIGIFIMSCFNPGEFCPLPYEMLVIISLVLLELNGERPFAGEQLRRKEK